MVVVADTSPVNYLVLIGQIEILPRLYARIAIPSAVLGELRHPVAPEPVRDWSAHPPGWLEVVTLKASPLLRDSTLEKLRQLLSQLKYMPKCCSSTSRQEDRKQHAVD